MSCPFECKQNCLRCITNCAEKEIYEQLKNDVPDNYVIGDDINNYPPNELETSYDEDI